MPSSRQLAAIMFTDIVGYTALMYEDEQKALQLLEKNRRIQKPLVERHDGKWIKEVGDGVLASFNSVMDAVNCACSINESCNKENGLQLRIGIHLGDVVFENNDVFGDGVNIASRLQALAPVGRIWISEAVYKNVSNKKEIRTRFVREEMLKNVKEPVRIYEVRTEDTTTQAEFSKPASQSLTKSVIDFRNKRKPLLFIGLTIFLLAIAGISYWSLTSQNTRQIDSIAVMPFVNESANTDIEYLSDGMTETLISYLSQLPNLDVKARSSVFRYKGRQVNAQTIGKELNVQAVLNGRLVQRGANLALFTELVDTRKETVLWSQDYNEPMSSLVSLQSEITRDVVQKLKTKLTGVEAQKLAKNYTANSEAYQLYLKGRYYWNRRTAKDVDKSIEYYQQAITLDSTYALAFAGLADSYTVPIGGTPSREKMLKGRDAARKALSFDDNLAEAHAAFGRVLTVYEFDFTAAEQEFRRAIELNPTYAVAYDRYSILLHCQGRWDEAFAQIRHALELEPLNPNFSASYGYWFVYARKYNEAIMNLKKTLELDPNFQPAHNFLSIAYWLNGDYQQSVEARAKAMDVAGENQNANLLRESYKKGGWTGFLRFAAREFIVPGTPFYGIATYYAALGEKDEAFAALNKSLENRETLLAQIRVDPRMDPLRGDPRFDELVQRLGFK